ncbi:MAG: HAD family hydrolase [Thermoleophilia bacterium]|nr:HAD family hydrolase [Thermoleophilia bacterium]
MPGAAVVDVDGTLVDTNYHHALCWYRAFREQDLVLPLCRLHRHVGMGGDQFVAAVAGDDVEERLGDGLRDRWEELFDAVIDEVAPLPGAAELLGSLKERGHEVVLASSSIQSHLDRFLDLLEARDVADAWTMKDEIDESKPAPDLVEAALAKAGTRDGVMIGDTVWDVVAARRAGIPTLCVLTGGFGEAELRDAGAAAVFASAADLRGRLDETPLS